MQKTWLIRTKNNHILGPVSKDKIKALLENTTLNLEDELCSGNGYWFSVKEDELVQKYIANDHIQTFNPISEAPTVLSLDGMIEDPAEEEIAIEDITQVKDLVDLLNQIEEEYKLDEPLSVEVLEPGDAPVVKLTAKELKVEDLKSEQDESSSSVETEKKTSGFSTTDLKRVKALNSTILYILAIAFFIIALIGFYYRRSLLENFLA